MVTALAGPALGVAQADDASVRKVAQAQEKKVKPLLDAFVKADAGFKGKADAPALKRTTTKLITGVKAYRTAILKEQASGAKVKTARKELLAQLKTLGLGLTTYRTAIAKIQDGATREEILGTLGKALDQIEKADKLSAKSEKALGIETEESTAADDGDTSET